MNQILITENKKKERKNNGPLDIKSIVRFFAIVIMIFGVVLIGEGTYSIIREAEEKKPSNNPIVTLSRINDKAIIHVQHNTEISKVIYSWNNGESTVEPQGEKEATVEVLLPNQNSTLNIIVEDMNGRQVEYTKQYDVENMDIEKPTIEVVAENGSNKMKITAKDETEIAYLSYQWEDGEETFVDAQNEGQTEITTEVELTPGTKKITIIAEDTNSNIEKIEKEITTTTSEPKLQIRQNGKQITLEVADEDGLQKVTLNLNGRKYETKQDLKAAKELKIGPVELQEGDNTIYAEVTNVSGYTKKAATRLQYVQ